MRLLINGQESPIPDAVGSLAELIALLGLEKRRIAVELNRVIVKRERYESTNLRDGDEIEILQFVGGG